MNNLDPPQRALEFGEIRQPPLDSAEVRAAVFREDGEESFVVGHLAKFDSLNPGVFLAQTKIEFADRLIKELQKNLNRLQRDLAWTYPLRQIVVADHTARLPLIHKVTASFQIMLAVLAFYMGNQVGKNYIVKSGTDLYAADSTGATLFMGIVLMASALLKAFEHQLRTDRAKSIYTQTLFVLGLSSFLLWSGAMAVSFAPTMADDVSWLTGLQGGGNNGVTTLLLATHIIADVTCGYTIFSGAEYMFLAGHKRVVVADPFHNELTKRVGGAVSALKTEKFAQADAEDYLSRHEAGRNLAEKSARLAFQRAASRVKHERDAAVAAAITKFIGA